MCQSKLEFLTLKKSFKVYKLHNFKTPDETLVCVVDFKREFGLWHAVLAATYVGMRVVFVPYSLTKMNPASWMVMATKMHASVAVVKSRDLHWGVLASRDTSEVGNFTEDNRKDMIFDKMKHHFTRKFLHHIPLRMKIVFFNFF